eukprot:9199039-Lingulodinium_polyedra.AAC.1
MFCLSVGRVFCQNTNARVAQILFLRVHWPGPACRASVSHCERAKAMEGVADLPDPAHQR